MGFTEHDDLFQSLRHEMVRTQLRSRGITDERVLEMMGRLARDEFLPTEFRQSAYDDRAVPLSDGQTLSQPYMVAIMTQLLELQRTLRVLEVGTGSGYQTAVLAGICPEVYTVERLAHLSHAARTQLARLGLNSVSYKVGDGTLGWQEHAPYDRILVTAGAPCVPQPLVDQLAEGGIIVIPVGGPQHQILTVLTRYEGKTVERPNLSCRFVHLIGQAGWPETDADE